MGKVIFRTKEIKDSYQFINSVVHYALQTSILGSFCSFLVKLHIQGSPSIPVMAMQLYLFAVNFLHTVTNVVLVCHTSLHNESVRTTKKASSFGNDQCEFHHKVFTPHTQVTPWMPAPGGFVALTRDSRRTPLAGMALPAGAWGSTNHSTQWTDLKLCVAGNPQLMFLSRYSYIHVHP